MFWLGLFLGVLVGVFTVGLLMAARSEYPDCDDHAGTGTKRAGRDW